MAEQLRISNGSARGADPNGPVLTNLAQLEPDILARNGVGIKVPSDGYVEFYGNKNPPMYFG